ncbi:MAG: ribonuclease HI [Thermoanaerobaculia bacterium]
MPDVTIYTDGACRGNPGPGGWGAVLLFAGHRREIAGGHLETTNNRMEMLAVITALRTLKRPCRVTVHSDSRYVVDAMSKGWAKKWRARGWRRNAKEHAANPDLWGALLDLCETHEVRFEWVRGHAGDPENERCDALAVDASCREDLTPDPGYRP